MLILGIETSCDDTSIALLETENLKVVQNNTFSQADIHTKFGGVVPEVASRNHMAKIAPLFTETLKKAKLNVKDIDMLAVTNSPGLIGSLLVGVCFAKGLAYALNKPIVPVHHLSGHILSAELNNPEFKPPYIAVVLSGGHSHIYEVAQKETVPSFRLLGRTVDDAAGETFDKIAKTLGGPYPGGPFIEELAKKGNPDAVKLPIALKNSDNFSFSGLKTAVLAKIGKHSAEDIAASMEKTIAVTAAEKLIAAAEKNAIPKIAVTGGVAINSTVRRIFEEKCKEKGLSVCFPEKKLCGDNALMIAYAAYRLNKDVKDIDLSFKAGDTAHEIG